MNQINAPWTPEQVAALNCWQTRGDVHPYTCPNGTALQAMPYGWECPCCEYTQYWAHAVEWPTRKEIALANIRLRSGAGVPLDEAVGWLKEQVNA